MQEQITAILLRLTVIEKLLIKQNLTTQEELKKELEDLFNFIASDILKAANVEGDLSELIKTLRDNFN